MLSPVIFWSDAHSGLPFVVERQELVGVNWVYKCPAPGCTLNITLAMFEGHMRRHLRTVSFRILLRLPLADYVPARYYHSCRTHRRVLYLMGSNGRLLSPCSLPPRYVPCPLYLLVCTHRLFSRPCQTPLPVQRTEAMVISSNAPGPRLRTTTSLNRSWSCLGTPSPSPAP